MEGFIAQKKLVEPCERTIFLRERDELPKEEGDAVREYKAVHEEHFLSSWLREGVRKKKKGRRTLVRRMKNKEEKKRKREEEKEENKTERVKRRCVGFVSVKVKACESCCG